jgi:cyanophycinase
MRASVGFLLLWLIAVEGVVAQGKIMLVGGGSEDDGATGWSNIPYQWAIDQSANKKVAVISYDDADNWIPDYFKSLGALDAVNIKIDSRAEADLQTTYDNLMQYDVFFFKGGDQSYYYNYYRDTKTHQAITDKFTAGGVITGTSAGMAILSEVIFAAQAGSVYPDDVLQNLNDSDITLVDNFLPFLPGFLVDSHFTERGRGARLMAFMAKWFETTGASVTGIGVDDRTAFCIDENLIGTVYGTGTVSIIGSFEFTNQSNRIVTDSVHVSQLIHGNIFDLNTLEIIDGPDQQVTPTKTSETANYEVLISGSESLSSNSNLLNFFVNSTGNPTDSVIVVTAAGKGTSFIQRLRSLNAAVSVVETSANYNHADSLYIRNTIRKSKKILYVDNDDAALFDFLQGGPTGALVREHSKRNKIITTFIGEDSRYAGKTFVTNHLSDQYAAYYGRFNYTDGLALLPTATIISDTYAASTSTYYENTTAAIPFAMVTDNLKHGIYLNRSSYIHCYQEEGENYWQSTGTFPAMVVINTGTTAAFVTQPVGSGSASRNYVGFSHMRYAFLYGSARLAVGTSVPSADLPYEFESPVLNAEGGLHQISLKVFPNPSENGIFHLSTSTTLQANYTVVVSDNVGKTMLTNHYSPGSERTIDLSALQSGIYFLTVMYNQQRYTLKVIR